MNLNIKDEFQTEIFVMIFFKKILQHGILPKEGAI
jgi:hypothetical protein